MEKSELLHQLRIDRNDKESHADRGAGFWIGLGVAGVLLVGLVGGGWWFLGQARAVEVDTVATQAPNAGTAGNAVLQATGYVTARRQATVSAQITGTLLEVLIEEGERVEEGQVLAKLVDTAQRAAVDQARAQVAQARAEATALAAQLQQARRDLERQQEMVGRKLVSAQAVENARTEVDMLQAQLDARRRSVDLAEAMARSAEVQLDYTTVRAPFAGVIVAKSAQVGEIVSPLSAGGGFTRTGVGTIVDMNSLEIEVDVNESYINRVQPGAPIEAILDAYPDWTIPGRVIAIIPTADRGKATVKVRIGGFASDPRILPDMGVRVSFLAAPTDAAGPPPPPPKGVLVPASAIVERDGRKVVFVIKDERAAASPVTPGRTFADLQLVEGVALGTKVVRAPSPELADGARVVTKK